MTVAECQSKVDAQEFASWIAYERIDPMGTERLEVMISQVSAQLANSKRTKKSDKLYEATDFIPKWDASLENKPSVVNLEDQFRMVMQAQGVKFIDG
tara:strand:- start:8713 stop:9003 length:291 start_codon:yes stop_codon:yes gene_type:complete